MGAAASKDEWETRIGRGDGAAGVGEIKRPGNIGAPQKSKN